MLDAIDRLPLNRSMLWTASRHILAFSPVNEN